MTKQSIFHKKNNWLTIPNLLSCLRICLIPVFVRLYCVEHNDLAAVLVFAFSSITDTLDGAIARRFGMVSDVGKILDPVADKLTQGVMLICLCTRYRLMVIPLALMIVKEAFVGLTSVQLIRRTGMVEGAEWHGKVATWVLYAVMLIHMIWPTIPAALSGVLIGICMLLMLLSFGLYAMKNTAKLKRLKSYKRTKKK